LNNPFSLYGNCYVLTKRREKEREKKEKTETKPIFESLYLGNAWCNLVEIWNMGY